MTHLSVNLNKIALLRNARGRDYPNVLEYARKVIELGVQGITVHPRQDERHATKKDTRELAELIRSYPAVEFNVEGFPSDDFMRLIEQTRPDQCTLVPDGPDQITSDHGWDVTRHAQQLTQLAHQLSAWNVRSSVFLDPDLTQVEAVSQCKVDRIELYTEQFAVDFATEKQGQTLALYHKAAEAAQSKGLGVNAGHDLDLNNLSVFLTTPNILEVSIGHALTIESLEYGMQHVIKKYLSICNA